MRGAGTGIVGLTALVALVVCLGSATAAAGHRRLVEGTVYDTTCATACEPECPPPPHCGPVTAQKSEIICAQGTQAGQVVVCPLETAGSAKGSSTGSSSTDSPSTGTTATICLPAGPTGCGFPVYTGEGAVVKVRPRGSATVLATLPVVEGHFKIRLGSGGYVLHPYLGGEPCWSGEKAFVSVGGKANGPVPAAVDVHDGCVAHPDAAARGSG